MSRTRENYVSVVIVVSDDVDGATDAELVVEPLEPPEQAARTIIAAIAATKARGGLRQGPAKPCGERRWLTWLPPIALVTIRVLEQVWVLTLRLSMSSR